MVNGMAKTSPVAAAAKNLSRRSEEEEAEYAKRVLALSHQEQDILKQKEIEIMKLQDQVWHALLAHCNVLCCWIVCSFFFKHVLCFYSQVTLQHVELCNLRSEIENQRRLYQESNRDEALKLAIAERDEAIIK